MKNKIKSIGSIAIVSLLTVPALALAQLQDASSLSGSTNLPTGSITSIATAIMRWILGLVGVVGVIGFAIAGVMYLTAAGDDTRIQGAKKAMMYSIMGVLVALLGLVVLQAFKAMLGGSSTTF